MAGAAVSLGTTGGTFENARGGRTTGVTDSQGNFRVSWRTMPAEVYTSDVPYEFRADVTSDHAAGQAAGVTGTPAFFINGRFLNGAQPFEAFKKLIDEELELAGKGS